MKWVIGIFVALVMIVGIYGSATDPNFWKDVQTEMQARAETEAQQPKDNTGLYVVGALIIIVVLWVTVSEIASHKAGVPILVILGGLALLGALYGLYMFGDKNADGQGDNQIVMVVQPTGADAETDLTYSEVNQENAKANVFNVSGFVMLVIAFVFAVFFLGFIGLMIGAFARNIG